MYRIFALLKQPLENAGIIESIVKGTAERLGVTYTGLSVGEYGSKRDGFIPIYCMGAKSKDYSFQINYHEGLGSFQSDKTKGFIRTDYLAKIEILGKTADQDMEYYNEFILICENIENQFDCILIEFDSESKFWVKV